jgi:hypothetical protein
MFRRVRPEADGHPGLLRQAPGALLPLIFLLAAAACATGMKAGAPAPTAAASPTATPTATPTVIPTATPTKPPTPTPTRTPTPTPKPFFPALVAIGDGGFVNVKGAPAGSVCSVKAFVLAAGNAASSPTPTGPNIASQAVKPLAVTDAAQGVSWNATPPATSLLNPPSSGPVSGQKAVWQATCTNNAYQPSKPTPSNTFDR